MFSVANRLQRLNHSTFADCPINYFCSRILGNERMWPEEQTRGRLMDGMDTAIFEDPVVVRRFLPDDLEAALEIDREVFGGYDLLHGIASSRKIRRSKPQQARNTRKVFGPFVYFVVAVPC